MVFIVLKYANATNRRSRLASQVIGFAAFNKERIGISIRKHSKNSVALSGISVVLSVIHCFTEEKTRRHREARSRIGIIEDTHLYFKENRRKPLELKKRIIGLFTAKCIP